MKMINDKEPLVSIIMGIYNCENTLKESIDSIINQSYENWELIMCDDGSTDKTYEIAMSYKKKYKDKIIVTKNNENSGLAASLNHCLEYVKGKYIARQDGDDMSVKGRFTKQVEFLENHKEFDLVGTSMISFNEKGDLGVTGILRENPDINKLAISPAFCHATIMARENVYKELKGYRVNSCTRRCEDIDLWFRFFHKGFKGYNLKEPLYKVRDDENAYKRRSFKNYFQAAKVCFDGYKLLNIPIKYRVFIVKPIIGAFLPTKLKKIYHNAKRK